MRALSCGLRALAEGTGVTRPGAGHSLVCVLEELRGHRAGAGRVGVVVQTLPRGRADGLGFYTQNGGSPEGGGLTRVLSGALWWLLPEDRRELRCGV